MKAVLLSAAIGLALALSQTSCSTAHGIAQDTHYVVHKTGDTAGYVLKKTGQGVQRVGHEIEEHVP